MPRVLASILVLSVTMLLVLSIVGWPRLRSTTIHYDLIRLRADVSELRREQQALSVALEEERSPERLAVKARALGLQPPAGAQKSSRTTTPEAPP